MDHVVYVDAASHELEKLIDGSKTIILRGASGRKLPYGRVDKGDDLYFIRNNGEGLIQAKATVNSVINSEKLTKEDSISLIDDHSEKLQLADKQYKKFAGKRYLVLIEINKFEKVEPFSIDRSSYGNMDDWLPVKEIISVVV